MLDEKAFDLEFSAQLTAVRDAAAKSTDACTTSKFIALSDNRVQTLLRKKIVDGDIFRGISCLNQPSIPENHYVYFDFDCKPGTLCFIKPSFAVIVNVIDGYVVAVLDPYIRSARTDVGTRGIRVRLAIQNNTLRDLWVVWSGQVHEDYHEDFVPNGQSKERPSEKVTSNANFRIDIHRNDGGRLGVHLGGFNQSVSVATSYDALTLIAPRVQIGGQEYVELTYVTATQVVKVIAQILLNEWLAGPYIGDDTHMQEPHLTNCAADAQLKSAAWYLTLVGEEFDGWFVSGTIAVQHSAAPYHRVVGLLLRPDRQSDCLWTFPDAPPSSIRGRHFFKNLENGKYLSAVQLFEHRMTDSNDNYGSAWDLLSIAEDRVVISNPNWRCDFFHALCLRVLKGDEGKPILTLTDRPPNDKASFFKLANADDNLNSP